MWIHDGNIIICILIIRTIIDLINYSMMQKKKTRNNMTRQWTAPQKQTISRFWFYSPDALKFTFSHAQ